MMRVPKDFKPLLDSLVDSFRRPETARRVVLFFAAAIITVGDRTVSIDVCIANDRVIPAGA